MTLKVEQRKTGDLLPYARNARKHSPDQVEQIAASIREFGFNNPLLIGDDGTIIAGHGRLQAALYLGLREVPVIQLPHLTDAQRRAYIIADNKLALNASWDFDDLKAELEALQDDDFDVELTGFTSGELTALFGDGGKLTPEGGNEESQSGLTNLWLTVDKERVPMSKEECEELQAALKQFNDAYGMTFGFVTRILEALRAQSEPAA